MRAPEVFWNPESGFRYKDVRAELLRTSTSLPSWIIEDPVPKVAADVLVFVNGIQIRCVRIETRN